MAARLSADFSLIFEHPRAEDRFLFGWSSVTRYWQPAILFDKASHTHANSADCRLLAYTSGRSERLQTT